MYINSENLSSIEISRQSEILSLYESKEHLWTQEVFWNKFKIENLPHVFNRIY